MDKPLDTHNLPASHGSAPASPVQSRRPDPSSLDDPITAAWPDPPNGTDQADSAAKGVANFTKSTGPPPLPPPPPPPPISTTTAASLAQSHHPIHVTSPTSPSSVSSSPLLASRLHFLQTNTNPLRASIFDTGLVVHDILPESRLHLVTTNINPLDRLKRDAQAILHNDSVLKSHRQWAESYIHNQIGSGPGVASASAMQPNGVAGGDPDDMDVDGPANEQSSDDDSSSSHSSDESDSDSYSDSDAAAPIRSNAVVNGAGVGADTTTPAFAPAGNVVAVEPLPHDPIMDTPDFAHFSFEELNRRRAEIDMALLQYLHDIGHLTFILDAVLAPPPAPTANTAHPDPADAIIRKQFHAIELPKPDLIPRQKLDHLLFTHAHHRSTLASFATQLSRGAADLAATLHADMVFFHTHALALRGRGWPLALPPPPAPGKPNPGAIMVDYGFHPYTPAGGALPAFPWPRALLYRVFPGQVVPGMDDLFPVPLNDEPLKPDAHTVVRVSPYLRVYLQVGGSAGRRREFCVQHEGRGPGAGGSKHLEGTRGSKGAAGAAATGVASSKVVTAATAFTRRARERAQRRNTQPASTRHPIDTILRRAQANYVTTFQLLSMMSDVAKLGPSYGYSSARVKDDDGRIVVPLGGAGDLMISMEEIPGSSDEDEEDGGEVNGHGNEDDAGDKMDVDPKKPSRKRKGRKRKRFAVDADGDISMVDPHPNRQPSLSAAAGQPDTSVRSMLDPLLLAMDMPLFDFVQWVEFSDFVRDIHAHVRRALQLARIVLPDASGVRMYVPQDSELPSAAGGGSRGGRASGSTTSGGGGGGDGGDGDGGAGELGETESWWSNSDSGLEVQVFLTPRPRAPRSFSSTPVPHPSPSLSSGTQAHRLLADRTTLPAFILGLSPPCKLFVRVQDAIRFRNLTPTSRQIQDLVNHNVERELAAQVRARVDQWASADASGLTPRVKVSVDWGTASGASGKGQAGWSPKVKLVLYAAGEAAVVAAGGLDAATHQAVPVKAVEVDTFGPGWVERALLELDII